MLLAVITVSTVAVSAAGILSIAVSKSSMNVGDTVVITVYSDNESGQAVNSTMKVTYDSTMLEYVSSSATSATGGGGSVSATGSEIEYTFKAVGGGTAAIQASAEGMTAAGVKIQVSGAAAASSESSSTSTSTDDSTSAESSASASENTGEAQTAETVEEQPEASADNSAEIPQNTGGLELVDSVNANVIETTGVQVTIADTVYEISASLSESDIPEGFSVVEILYGDGTVTGVNNATGSISMFYMVNTTNSSDQGFFVYDSASQSFYPFVRVMAGNTKVQIIKAPEAKVSEGGYNEGVIGISGKSVYGYTAGDSSTFYSLYTVDVSGSEGWYQYDSDQFTIQRQNNATVSSESGSSIDDDTYNALTEKYNTLNEKYSNQKNNTIKVVGAFVFVLAVLIIVIINLLLKIKDIRDEYEEDFDDDDDEDEETDSKRGFVEEQFKKQEVRNSSPVQASKRTTAPVTNRATAPVASQPVSPIEEKPDVSAQSLEESILAEAFKEIKQDEKATAKNVADIEDDFDEDEFEDEKPSKRKGLFGRFSSKKDEEEEDFYNDYLDDDDYGASEEKRDSISVRETVMRKNEETLLGKKEKTPEFKASEDDDDLEFLDL